MANRWMDVTDSLGLSTHQVFTLLKNLNSSQLKLKETERAGAGILTRDRNQDENAWRLVGDRYSQVTAVDMIDWGKRTDIDTLLSRQTPSRHNLPFHSAALISLQI
jgi:hypothetical protein